MGGRRSLVIVLLLVLLLTACGTTSAGVDSSATSPEPTSQIAVSHDPVIVGSLEEQVEISPMIFIGEVVGLGEVINMARMADNRNQPDPYIFILGQVYQVKTESYLKGSGPQQINVVQPEGFISGNSEPVEAPKSQAEIDRLKAADHDHVAMTVGNRYLFFVHRMEGFDPNLNYVTTSSGYPWRYALPVDGEAQAESPYATANNLFPTMPSAEIVETVKALIRQ